MTFFVAYARNESAALVHRSGGRIIRQEPQSVEVLTTLLDQGLNQAGTNAPAALSGDDIKVSDTTKIGFIGVRIVTDSTDRDQPILFQNAEQHLAGQVKTPLSTEPVVTQMGHEATIVALRVCKKRRK